MDRSSFAPCPSFLSYPIWSHGCVPLRFVCPRLPFLLFTYFFPFHLVVFVLSSLPFLHLSPLPHLRLNTREPCFLPFVALFCLLSIHCSLYHSPPPSFRPSRILAPALLKQYVLLSPDYSTCSQLVVDQPVINFKPVIIVFLRGPIKHAPSALDPFCRKLRA